MATQATLTEADDSGSAATSGYPTYEQALGDPRYKKAKDLCPGDRVEEENGTRRTITRVSRGISQGTVMIEWRAGHGHEFRDSLVFVG